jgi:hypothetical protein
MKTAIVTRRTRNIGFAWTTGMPPIERPSKPEYTGTLRTVLQRANNDRDLQAVESGNTLHSTAFFVGNKRVVCDDAWRYGVDLLLDGTINHLSLTLEQ